MGYMRHHAIVLSGWDQERLQRAHAKAEQIFNTIESRWGGHETFAVLVSPILGSVVNEYSSFFIAPDGSKEGWDTSDLGDALRKEFTDWLRTEDPDGYISWVEVQFGDDDKVTKIVSHSDEVLSDEGDTDVIDVESVEVRAIRAAVE